MKRINNSLAVQRKRLNLRHNFQIDIIAGKVPCLKEQKVWKKYWKELKIGSSIMNETLEYCI